MVCIDPAITAAGIGAAATLIAAGFGFGAIFVQLRSQGQQSRDAIAENERRKLKAEMYEAAVVVCRETADTAIELSNQHLTMSFELTVASRAAAANLGYDLPSTRFLRLMSLYQAFSDAALRFIFLVENRQFIDPRLIVFRTAMSVVLHETRDLMFREYPLHVMPALPAEMADGTVFPYTPPGDLAVKKIVSLAERMTDALSDAQAYTEDFLVELQNILMGDLFEVNIPTRVPADPARKVVTLKAATELEKWFRANTAWGRENAKAEADALKRYQPDVALRAPASDD